MSYNGAGVFSRLYSWATDKINGIKILASRMDAEFDNIANGMSECIVRDGQTTLTGNIPFAGFKATGLGDGTTAGDALAYDQAGASLADLTLTAGLTGTTGTFSAGLSATTGTFSSTVSMTGLTATTGTFSGAVSMTDLTATTGTFSGVVDFPDGSASAPSITNTGDTNTGVFFPAADTVGIATAGSEALRVDSAGNMGLGVTPGTWTAGYSAAQFGSVGALYQASSNGSTVLGRNIRYEAGGKYLITDEATIYAQTNTGEHQWFTAPSGTAGNAITFTQAMTLTNGGNLLVGTTTDGGAKTIIDDPSSGVSVDSLVLSNSASATGSAAKLLLSGTNVTATRGVYIEGHNDNSTNNGHSMRFGVSAAGAAPAEVARITSGGNLLVGTTSGATRLVVGSTASTQNEGITVSTGGSYAARLVSDSSGTAAVTLVANGSASAVDGVPAGTIGIGTSGTKPFVFTIGATEKARITSGGNLLVGTTTDSGFPLEVAGIARAEVFRPSLADSAAAPGLQIYNEADTGLFRAGADTLGISTGGTERARITSGGNLLVGTTTDSSYKLKVAGAAALARFEGASTTTILYEPSTDVVGFGASLSGDSLALLGGGAERARITSGGYFKASNDGTYFSATGSYHELNSNQTGQPFAVFSHTHATNPFGMIVDYVNASPDNNTNEFLRCRDSTTSRCIIYSDGDVVNHDGTYGTISDETLKSNIVDANSQWDDFKAFRFRNFQFNTDIEQYGQDAPTLLGVIAQELEQVSPGLVKENGEGIKQVKQSILYMKAMKVIQELQTRVEQLEAHH